MRKWINIDEFLKTPSEGLCWIIYKGRVVSAYHHHNGSFAFSAASLDRYTTECITKVIPIMKPVKPIEQNTVNDKIKKYDGCSGGMSVLWIKIFKRPPPWEGCCDIHDQPYAKGGTAEQRKQADIDLMVCVIRSGHPILAATMWAAVRVGGVPWLPTPWRWGFTTKNRGYLND